MEDLVQGKMIVARRACVVLAVILVACADRQAPEPEIQPVARLEPDSSRSIEIIGLRRWTAEMVRDSLKKYAPDEGIESESAAANLRNLIGFADAATTTHSLIFDESEQSTVTIAVREPTDSARVRYAPQTLDTLPRRGEWHGIATAFLNDSSGRMDVPRRLQVVAGAHLDGPARIVVDSTLKGRSITHTEGFEYESPADSLAAKRWLDSLASRTSDADFAAAVDVANTSSSGPDRVLATLILSNFPQRDDAWRSILKIAVGREQARDAVVAQHALRAMADRHPRAVDWTPVDSIIRDVLDGTALAALAPLAKALAATGANPRKAVAWLAGGGEMLTAFVESDNPDIRDPAHDLLVRLRGQDLGLEPGPWREWIRGLKPPV